MTQKFDNFVKALEALCVEHKVLIAPSGYDTIDVWDLQDADELILNGLCDETREVVDAHER